MEMRFTRHFSEMLKERSEEEIMRLRVSKKDDALYFRLDESAVVDSEEVRPGVILDYDKEGRVVGVEFLGIKARVPEEELSSLQFQTG